MCKLILFLTIPLTFAAPHGEDEVCLLSLRAQLSQRRSLYKSQKAALASEHQEGSSWSTSNAELKRQLASMTVSSSAETQKEMDTLVKEADASEAEGADGAPPTVSDSGVRITTSTDEIDEFMMDQIDSKDTCTSKMMEAKRSVDGVAAKVIQLSDEIEAEQSIINSQKMVVDGAIAKLEESEAQEEADLAACQKAFEEQWAALDGKRNEIVELEQIARPSVRSSIAHDMDVEAYVNKHIDKMEARFRNASMESMSEIQITEENCQRVVDFLNQKADPEKESPHHDIKYSVIDCTAARQRLQDEFTDAYNEITKLIAEGEAAATSEKERCDLTAKNDEDERSSQLNLQIARCTADITAAKDTIHELEPLMQNGEEETKILDRWIKKLGDMCAEDENVTEHLRAVRRLIMSLEKCPGRNDFKLMIPGQKKEQDKLKR